MTTLLPTLVRAEGMDPYMEAGGSLSLGEGLTLHKYDPSVHGPLTTRMTAPTCRCTSAS